MARVLGGIAIATTQFDHIFLRAKHAGDDEFVERYTLDIKAVEEGLSDILQQNGCMGNEVWDARIERVDMIIGRGVDIDEFALASLGIRPVLHRTNAPLTGSGELQVVGVGESHSIVGNREDAVWF